MFNEHGSRPAWNLNISQRHPRPRFSAAAAEKAVEGDFETKFMPTVKACACATDGSYGIGGPSPNSSAATMAISILHSNHMYITTIIDHHKFLTAINM